MSKAAMNLQDSFLNQVRRENSEVRVLLVNGTLLRGVVKGFDNFTLILNNRNGQHLVYKHAIAQIVTHRPHVKPEEMAAGDAADVPANSSEEAGETPEAARSEKPAMPGRSRNEKAGTGDRPKGDKPAGSDRPRREGQRRDQRDKSKQDQSHQKKEGFNTLDLSGVKLGDK